MKRQDLPCQNVYCISNAGHNTILLPVCFLAMWHCHSPHQEAGFIYFFLAYWTNIIRERWLESLFRLSLKRSATWNTSSWTPSVVLCKACIAMWRDPCGGKQRLPVDSPSWATTWQPAPHVNEEGCFGAHCCTSA